ncbi:CMP-N-acetlyneuraminic acid synthetase [Candidatus Kaiserbacteria bacterium CG10_big_fil_rev_8_21_14_0_10_49_17]|uniref:CMP-N-acetlyneuraminic acid synthetase n=1 Tax=Candidatus Kaiserbacteria bacterium CG10_big_fil_rev_8_21_14_0_10_49_17 TaxID=1974609 RepID=A0A2M6WDX8_9BACT|nr:MAG: CMP-N-acetlyneuraminic acid synthetase [Candidatus Kaiserbacteria bacterium CG10_big_fil_rev_8_21_14_0_10_49_17]
MTKEKKQPHVLAIIPARGGSKRVPRKNIKRMAGRPLIYYMLEAALNSKSVTHVALSSEDDAILATAKRLSKKIGVSKGKTFSLIKRPKRLATDTAATLPVVQHALQKVEKEEGIVFDVVVLLQPNSPLIVWQDIDNTVDILLRRNADSVWSVYQDNALHPVKMKKLLPDGRLAQMVPSMPERTFRRQDLPDTYKRNGGIYTSTRDFVVRGQFKTGYFGGKNTYPYVMPEERSVDIDTPKDFLFAEMLIQKGYRRYFLE